MILRGGSKVERLRVRRSYAYLLSKMIYYNIFDVANLCLWIVLVLMDLTHKVLFGCFSKDY